MKIFLLGLVGGVFLGTIFGFIICYEVNKNEDNHLYEYKRTQD